MYPYYNLICCIFCTKGDTLRIGYIQKTTDHLHHQLRIYPYARVVFLQIFSIKGSGKFFSFQCLQNVGITRNTSIYFIWSLPRGTPFAEFRILSSYRQNQLPYQISLGKGLDFNFLIVPSTHSGFVCFNIYKSI